MNKRIKKKKLKQKEQMKLKQPVLKKGISQSDFQKLYDEVNRYGSSGELTSAEEYVRIKKYHELVSKGFIKEVSNFDKYSVAEVMDDILSDEEKDKLIEEAEKKGEELAAKWEEKVGEMAERGAVRYSFSEFTDFKWNY